MFPWRPVGTAALRRFLLQQARRMPARPVALIPARQLGFFKVFVRATKIPAYIGGTVAAGGSYVAYKVEQALAYTLDTFGQVKDFASDVFGKTGDFFKSFQGKELEGGDGDGGGPGGDNATAVGATAAAVGLSTDDSESSESGDDEDDDEDDDSDDQMLSLTRQMLEIRAILNSVDPQLETLKVPSIVVIGLQLSGKSSVLEAIVGHEFLPKGSNMVTRRPIELTLVNAPDLASETAEFPALKVFGLTDFGTVQKTLYDLNMAVPASECISSDPIQVTIRSPRVPDLSLVDLPGYIQVEAADQPAELKTKIRQVCERYLEAPNVILAISAADVDLANSAALRAAKAADPRGERTVGVITKVDLVDPERARAVLLNDKYPLRMGYVGVVTRVPSTPGLFNRGVSGHQAYAAQQRLEGSFFREHRADFADTTTGTRRLKRKLMRVLERSMSLALRPTAAAILRELEETAYQFKVEFNDRALTPQMYLANNVDVVKVATKELSQRFSRRELRALLKNELDQRVLALLAERYWNEQLRELSQVAHVDEELPWHRALELATGTLTKLGVGRAATQLVTAALVTEVDNVVGRTQLANHPMAREVVAEAARAVLQEKYHLTADQVENSIKPYKYEVELENREWAASRESAAQLLKEELRQCEAAQAALKREVGGRKLAQVVAYLDKLHSKARVDPGEALGFSKALVEKGNYALFLRQRLLLLRMRHQFVKALKRCRSKENKYQCPEVFLDAVTAKMTATAVLFLNVELLSDFYYNFPRRLDEEFFGNMLREQMEALANEDPKVKRHIRLQERKDLLEQALSKIEGVMALQRQRGRFG